MQLNFKFGIHQFSGPWEDGRIEIYKSLLDKKYLYLKSIQKISLL